MKKIIIKPYVLATAFTLILFILTGYVLLDTFVIPRGEHIVELPRIQVSDDISKENEIVQAEPVITENDYQDSNIQIHIETVRVEDTTIYAADVQITDVQYLRTALANNTYGRNIRQTTSAMAEEHQAIFAVNGDYYGFRDTGLVIRNGVLYRSIPGVGFGANAMVLQKDGTLSIVNEKNTDAFTLVDAGVTQGWSFGPVLIQDDIIMVDDSVEVDQAMTSNPRTAIGMVEPLHYIFVVSDGRTQESTGLSLQQLAQFMQQKGCSVAYNLDGGGSSTMWFQGRVVNNPTTTGKSSSERKISDIIYLGN